MDKKKALIIGGGAIAAGVILYSQKGKDTLAGSAGSIIAAPIDTFTGAEDAPLDADDKKDTGISEIFEMLPELPGEGGSMLPWTPPPQMPGYGGDAAEGTKKRFSLPSMSGLGGVAGKAIVGGTRVGATATMLPTQILGGGVARVTDRGIRYAMGDRMYKKKMVPAQRARTRKYPRASHAVSMITGGATRRAPVSKKQQAARKKYPRVYKAWKSVFSWVGA